MSKLSDKQQSSVPIGEFNTLSTSTPKNHKSAIQHYDKFVTKQNELFASSNTKNSNGSIKQYPKFSELTTDFVCGKVLENGSIAEDTPPIAVVMSQFATYIFESEKDDGDPYAPLARAQFFSSFKAVLFTRFAPLSYGNEGKPQWYNDLYRGLKLRACALCIKRGGTVTKKHVGFPKKVLVECVKFLLKKYRDGTGYEERAALVMLFHAVGRGSEVAATTWDSATWDEDRQMLIFDWGEFKGGQQYIMTLHPSADVEDGWVLDSFHSTASYLLCAPTKYKASASAAETGINFMFPAYVDMADGGAASKVSRTIEKCREGGAVEGIPDDLTSHGIRVAAADEMMFNVNLPFFSAIARGGWDCKADTLLFFYLTQKLHVATAGKALAGWADPTMPVIAPTLEAIYNDSNRELIDYFCHFLFQDTSISVLLSDPQKLKGFRSRMVASLLMYYTNVKKALGSDCDIIKKIGLAWCDCGLDVGDLEKYCDKIKERFLIDNAASLAAASGTKEEQMQKAYTALQSICLKNSTKLTKVENKLDRMSEETTETKVMVEKILLATLSRQQSPSSGQKRKSPPEDTSASQSSASVAPRSMEEYLLDAQRKAQQKEALSEDWNKLGKWDSAKLLVQCLQNMEDFKADNFLRNKLEKGSTGNTRRSRAKAVLKELERVALQENATNRIYFHYRYVPKMDQLEERKGYFNRVTELVMTWASTAKNEWYTIYKLKKGIPDSGPDFDSYIRKKNRQQMNVSALGGFLEEVRKGD